MFDAFDYYAVRNGAAIRIVSGLAIRAHSAAKKYSSTNVHRNLYRSKLHVTDSRVTVFGSRMKDCCDRITNVVRVWKGRRPPIFPECFTLV